MSEPVNQTALLPWQHTQFNRLHALWSNDRLAHAWLLTGKPGIGKLEFAQHMARHLFCRKSTPQGPCGACQDCHLFQAGTHPDWLLLQPELRQLKIEMIRDAIEFAQNTAQRNGAKVIVIKPAEAMNNNSANALLKTLEEPTARTFLFLISEQPGLLLPTLRSRCQLLEFPAPPQEQAMQWLQTANVAADKAAFYLQLAHGAPLHALHLAQQQAELGFEVLLTTLQALIGGKTTPVQAAKKCEELGIRTSIDYQLLSVAGMLSAVQAGTTLPIPGLQSLMTLCNAGSGVSMIRRLHGLYQNLVQARQTAMAVNNANPQLMQEALFAEWSNLAVTGRPSRSTG
ncbi:MAG: DNA polymerase III subunit delta' [Pseudomonadota bacterium]